MHKKITKMLLFTSLISFSYPIHAGGFERMQELANATLSQLKKPTVIIVLAGAASLPYIINKLFGNKDAKLLKELPDALPHNREVDKDGHRIWPESLQIVDSRYPFWDDESSLLHSKYIRFKHPHLFMLEGERQTIRYPSNFVLFYGPSGCGKTYMFNFWKKKTKSHIIEKMGITLHEMTTVSLLELLTDAIAGAEINGTTIFYISHIENLLCLPIEKQMFFWTWLESFRNTHPEIFVIAETDLYVWANEDTRRIFSAHASWFPFHVGEDQPGKIKGFLCDHKRNHEALNTFYGYLQENGINSDNDYSRLECLLEHLSPAEIQDLIDEVVLKKMEDYYLAQGTFAQVEQEESPFRDLRTRLNALEEGHAEVEELKQQVAANLIQLHARQEALARLTRQNIQITKEDFLVPLTIMLTNLRCLENLNIKT